MGHCGMSRVEAAQVSLPEFNQRYKAWSEEMRLRWEIARWQVWHEYRLSPYIKPADKPKTPLEILRFPDEKLPIDNVNPEECHITPDVEDELNRIYKDFKERQQRYGQD